MADFYPLLSRAVANLTDATDEKRQAIYERARNALLGQLHAAQPEPEQAVIDAELAALAQAVERVEQEQAERQSGAATEAPAPAAPRPGPPPIAPPPAAASTPAATTPPRNPGILIKPPPSRVQPAPPRPQAAVPAPSAPAPAPAAMAPPAVPVSQPSAAGTEAGSMPEAADMPAASDLPVAAGLPDVTEAPLAPEKAPLRPIEAEPAPGAQQAPILSAPAPGTNYTSAAASTADSAQPAQQVAYQSVETGGGPSYGRPQAAQAQQQPKRRKMGGLLTITAILFVAAAGVIGYFSWQARLLPERLTSGPLVTKPAQTSSGNSAQSAGNSGDGKIAQRANPDKAGNQAGNNSSAPTTSGDTPSAPATQARAPADNPAGTPAQQPAGGEPARQDQARQNQAGQGIAVAQRASLLVQAKGGKPGDKPENYDGTVVWKTQNISRGAGQPLSFSLRAEVSIPAVKLSATMTIEKNTDATLPASHMITWRFKRDEGATVPGVSEIGVLQMHDDDSRTADQLTGAQAKITPEIYIYALAAPEALQTANMETLRARNWFILPIKLDDNREARLSLEKGTPGARMLAQAFEKWGVKFGAKQQ